MKSTQSLPSMLSFIVCIAQATTLYGHCQIPCGIFDDQTQFSILLEHTKTIEKSINQIAAETKADAPNYNQLVRWINNKEQHANEIQTIVAEYFLAQRIKPGQDHYQEKLVLLHAIIIHAMKTKQSLDSTHVQTLRAKIKAFKAIYLDHQHFSEN